MVLFVTKKWFFYYMHRENTLFILYFLPCVLLYTVFLNRKRSDVLVQNSPDVLIPAVKLLCLSVCVHKEKHTLLLKLLALFSLLAPLFRLFILLLFSVI